MHKLTFEQRGLIRFDSAPLSVLQRKRKVTQPERCVKRPKPNVPETDATLPPFSRYYQNFLRTDDEFSALLDCLQTKLPTTFRINGSLDQAIAFRDMMERKFISRLSPTRIGSHEIPRPSPIAWVPNRLAWKYEASKELLAKSSEFESFHEFLVQAQESGDISRQEEVSMIPSHFLRIEPHHAVLDMCASPGSKTAQLITDMHSNDGSDSKTTSPSIPTGLIVANDASYKRACMLANHTARLHSPCLMVTNHDAQFFPLQLLLTRPRSADGDSRAATSVHRLSFDRILCDVPCSGDGTMRKLPRRALVEWSPAFASRLHATQVAICMRGLRLLRAGGRLVYSTCSLNPIENEAVVAEVLRQCKASNGGLVSSVRLVDVSRELRTLKRSSGLDQWSVFDEQLREYASHADYLQRQCCEDELVDNDATMSDAKSSSSSADSKASSKQAATVVISASMFCPSSLERSTFNLHRCMRFWPHVNNTGGFFVAVFENSLKRHEQRAELQDSDSEPSKKERQKERKLFPLNEILHSVNENDPAIANLRTHYNFNEHFPANQLFVRADQLETRQLLVFASSSLTELLKAHCTSAQLPYLKGQRTLRVIGAGLRMFELAGAKKSQSHSKLEAKSSGYSLLQSSVNSTLPFMTPFSSSSPTKRDCRLFSLQSEDLVRLLRDQRLAIKDVADVHVRLALSRLRDGYVIVCGALQQPTSNTVISASERRVALVCRNGSNSLALCLSKSELWSMQNFVV